MGRCGQRVSIHMRSSGRVGMRSSRSASRDNAAAIQKAAIEETELLDAAIAEVKEKRAQLHEEKQMLRVQRKVKELGKANSLWQRLASQLHRTHFHAKATSEHGERGARSHTPNAEMNVV